MRDERLARRRTVIVHQLEDVCREAGLSQHIAEEHSGQGVSSAGFTMQRQPRARTHLVRDEVQRKIER